MQIPWVGEFCSVADADSGVLRLIFRYSYRKGFVNEHSETRRERANRRVQGEKRRRRDTKHVTQRDENGRRWPGPAVARMAPQCGISATILMEAGLGPSPGVNSLIVFCVCLCFFVCVCTMLVRGSVRGDSGGGLQQF